MQRKNLADLKSWLLLKNRKPLVLRGARQVGKSTLVRLFCQQEGLDLIEINFEKVNLDSLKHPTQIEKILREIEVITNKKINSKSLIFFDEIQKVPQIFQSLRYLYEEKQKIPIVAAGSLLDFILEAPHFDVPVGRIQYMHLGPMTFYEFLNAVQENELLNELKKINRIESVFLHKVQEWLQLYFFIGGMPEAIKTYLDSKNLNEVSLVHQSILQTYKDDFNKYAKKKDLPGIELLFERLCFFLGKKIKYSELHPHLDYKIIKNGLHLFKQARLLHFCFHSNGSGLPLRSQKNEKIFKMYFLDVGLMNAVLGIKWTFLQKQEDLILLNSGLIAEQFIAQHLAYANGPYENPELFYWLRDEQSQKAEVDFLITHNSIIKPVEVKSGEHGKLKSLNLFMSEKKLKEALRFDTHQDRLTFQKVSLNTKMGKMQVKASYQLNNLHLAQIENLSQDAV